MIAKMRILCAKAYLMVFCAIWRCLSRALQASSFGRAYGRYMHGLVCRYSDRKQNHSTFFLRNRPELELICHLLKQKASGSRVDIAVIGCSNGAEVYSIVWAIRSSRPDLKINLQAVDISQRMLDAAEQGIYSHFGVPDPTASGSSTASKTCAVSQDQRMSMFARMNSQEVNEMFETSGGQFRIRPYLKKGIRWLRADAASPGLETILGRQDLIIANRFLCHMEQRPAEACLRNIARLAKPGSHLGVSGVDLDVRTKVARDLEWKPVIEMMEAVHEGDPSLTQSWPYSYWGVEPFSTGLRGWEIRYASFFQTGSATGEKQVQPNLSEASEFDNDDLLEDRPTSSATFEMSGGSERCLTVL